MSEYAPVEVAPKEEDCYFPVLASWGSTNEWFKGHATKVYVSYDGNEHFDIRFEPEHMAVHATNILTSALTVK